MDFSFFKNLFNASSKAKDQKDEAPVQTAAPAAAPEDAGAEGPQDVKASRRPRRDNGARHGGHAREASEPPSSISQEDKEKLLAKLESFVQFTARSLVDEPEQVSTRIAENDNTSVILVSCAKKDTGKVIGKSGKIIAAIRILVSGSATKAGLKATVDIDE